MHKPLSKLAKSIKPGIYRHYKGQDYRVFWVARHEETGEELIIYLALYPLEGEYVFWARPLAEFFSEITYEDKLQPRFTFLHE